MKYVNTAESARESVWRAITSGGCSSATVAVMDGGKFVYSRGSVRQIAKTAET